MITSYETSTIITKVDSTFPQEAYKSFFSYFCYFSTVTACSHIIFLFCKLVFTSYGNIDNLGIIKKWSVDLSTNRILLLIQILELPHKQYLLSQNLPDLVL